MAEGRSRWSKANGSTEEGGEIRKRYDARMRSTTKCVDMKRKETKALEVKTESVRVCVWVEEGNVYVVEHERVCVRLGVFDFLFFISPPSQSQDLSLSWNATLLYSIRIVRSVSIANPCRHRHSNSIDLSVIGRCFEPN